MSKTDETTPLNGEQAAAEAEAAAVPAAEASGETEAATSQEAEEKPAEDAKQKEKAEKERIKREAEEKKREAEEKKKREAEEKKREAEEKKREAEEKKREAEEKKKREAEEKKRKREEAKAAKAEASAAVESKPRRSVDLAIDIVNRDKNQINSHINVQFEDIIAEPDPTVFSFDSVWTVSYKVFTSTKLWCYRIISLICAVPAAICWGIEFALLSFCTIWCWQPSLKAFDISLWYTRRTYEILLKVFVEPCFHAIGKCLSHIVVTVRHEA